MNDLVSRRARLRFEREAYCDVTRTCSVTTAVRFRQRVFVNAALATTAVELVRAEAASTHVRVWAYCVMPDHVHIVLSPSTSCDVISFVGRFKSLVTRSSWRLGFVGSFWQPRFWDHFIPTHDEVLTQVAYVLDNPVRAGIARTVDAYPYSGIVDVA